MPTKRFVLPEAQYRGCTLPPASLANRVAALTQTRTEKGVRDRFGISYYTWRNICGGVPVRTSVLERLEMRVRKLEMPAAD